MFIQCVLFVAIPLGTLLAGIWITRVHFPNYKNHRIVIALLWGIIVFEASIIGLWIDPRSKDYGLSWMLGISFIIGVVNSFLVMIIVPIYEWISKNILK